MRRKEAMEEQQSLIAWKDEVEDHDYQAAFNFLSIAWGEDRARLAVKLLRRAESTTRRANDILRAAGLEPLPITDPGVHKDLVKVLSDKKLSPILMVSCETKGGSFLAVIADGYHRVCLTYDLAPGDQVPMKLAHFSDGGGLSS
jgi:hypothetical protein